MMTVEQAIGGLENVMGNSEKGDWVYTASDFLYVYGHEIIELLRSHIEGRVVTDEMVDKLKSALFKDHMAYQHAMMNPHTSNKFWAVALQAALEVGK